MSKINQTKKVIYESAFSMVKRLMFNGKMELVPTTYQKKALEKLDYIRKSNNNTAIIQMALSSIMFGLLFGYVIYRIYFVELKQTKKTNKNNCPICTGAGRIDYGQQRLM